MAKRFAKVFSDITTSKRMAALWRLSRGAFGMFPVLKAASDDWGRYRADADHFAYTIGGYCQLDPAEAEEFMQAMMESGVIEFYYVGGERFLQICDYHSHANEDWRSVGSPEWPIPDGWAPQVSLVEFLVAYHNQRNITLHRYGIDASNCPNELSHLLNGRSTVVERSLDDGSTSDERSLLILSTSLDVTASTTPNVESTTPQELELDTEEAADSSNGGRKRGPKWTGNLLAIKRYAKGCNWPGRETEFFLDKLKAACAVQDTYMSLNVWEPDEAAGKLFEVLQNTQVDFGAFGTWDGRAKLISRLIQEGRRIAEAQCAEAEKR